MNSDWREIKPSILWLCSLVTMWPRTPPALLSWISPSLIWSLQKLWEASEIFFLWWPVFKVWSELFSLLCLWLEKSVIWWVNWTIFRAWVMTAAVLTWAFYGGRLAQTVANLIFAQVSLSWYSRGTMLPIQSVTPLFDCWLQIINSEGGDNFTFASQFLNF